MESQQSCTSQLVVSSTSTIPYSIREFHSRILNVLSLHCIALPASAINVWNTMHDSDRCVPHNMFNKMVTWKMSGAVHGKVTIIFGIISDQFVINMVCRSHILRYRPSTPWKENLPWCWLCQDCRFLRPRSLRRPEAGDTWSIQGKARGTLNGKKRWTTVIRVSRLVIMLDVQSCADLVPGQKVNVNGSLETADHTGWCRFTYSTGSTTDGIARLIYNGRQVKVCLMCKLWGEWRYRYERLEHILWRWSGWVNSTVTNGTSTYCVVWGKVRCAIPILPHSLKLLETRRGIFLVS